MGEAESTDYLSPAMSVGSDLVSKFTTSTGYTDAAFAALGIEVDRMYVFPSGYADDIHTRGCGVTDTKD